jgi:hypothetical protein
LYIGIINYYFSGIWLGLNDIKSEGKFVWEYSGASFSKYILKRITKREIILVTIVSTIIVKKLGMQ